jgi:hypothetical protein
MQAAFRAARERVAKWKYSGGAPLKLNAPWVAVFVAARPCARAGCPRDMSGCPRHWQFAEAHIAFRNGLRSCFATCGRGIQDGLCKPEPSYDGLCKAFGLHELNSFSAVEREAQIVRERRWRTRVAQRRFRGLSGRSLQ